MRLTFRPHRSVDSCDARGLVVLGMHRSGTSAVMHVLRAMGAFVGEDIELNGANEENPHGFLERKDVRALCDSMLFAANADWWKLAAWSPTQLNPDALERLLSPLDEIVTRLESRSPWAIKEPRLSLLYPLVQSRLPKNICLIAYRHPLEVAMSLEHRNGFPLSAGMALWALYMTSAIHATRRQPRVFVSHRELLSDPRQSITRLHSQLQHHGMRSLTPPAQSAAFERIDPQLYRQKVPPGDDAIPLLFGIRQIWNALESGRDFDKLPLSVSEVLSHILNVFEWGQAKSMELSEARVKLAHISSVRVKKGGSLSESAVTRDASPPQPSPLVASTPVSHSANAIPECTVPMPDKSQPTAITGADRQLFLSDDSNDSVGQFMENRTLSEASTKGWEASLNRLKALESTYQFRSAVLIGPSKEDIFPDKYPLPRAKRTIFDDFLSKFSERVIYPKWSLKNRREFTYTPTDTHWTDYGAAIAAADLLKYWQVDKSAADKLPTNYSVKQRIGDLGNKVTPRQADYELIFSEDIDSRIVFSNGVTNHGNITAYRHPEAPLQSKLLILGDSFGTNLAAALSSVFSEVVYTYCPASFDSKLVELVRPDYVLLEITQRFVHGQPDFRANIFETARRKIISMSEADQRACIDRIKAQPEIFDLKRSLLSIL